MNSQIQLIAIFYFIFLSTTLLGSDFGLEEHHGPIFFPHQFSYADERIPQIDINKFDRKEMLRILLHYGSFELIGVDDLFAPAELALTKAEEILNLDLANLEKVQQENFHGFQNVRKETLSKWQLKKDAGDDLTGFVVRNQIAYHYKPYKEINISSNQSKIPFGMDASRVDITALDNYYAAGMKVLHRLYAEIAKGFIEDRNNISRLKMMFSLF